MVLLLSLIYYIITRPCQLSKCNRQSIWRVSYSRIVHICDTYYVIFLIFKLRISEKYARKTISNTKIIYRWYWILLSSVLLLSILLLIIIIIIFIICPNNFVTEHYLYQSLYVSTNIPYQIKTQKTRCDSLLYFHPFSNE